MQLKVVLLALAACGGAKPMPVTTPTAEPAAEKVGSSGVKTLDWGASADAIKAVYPQVTANPAGGLWNNGTADGMTAITSFKLAAGGGLEAVQIEWTEGFPTMNECSTAWKKLRATYDNRYGKSQADNLAAYWKAPTVAVTLACNPNDSGAGVLTASFAKEHD